MSITSSPQYNITNILCHKTLLYRPIGNLTFIRFGHVMEFGKSETKVNVQPKGREAVKEKLSELK